MREKISKQLEDEGIITIIRMDEPEKIKKVVKAIYQGGLTAIEITFSVTGALNIIQEVRRQSKDKILLGAGTILTVKNVHDAIDAGAQYVISPILKKELIEAAHECDVPIIPGCMTPTEMQQAHEWGADFIKVFPAKTLGIEYLKLIRAPLPHLKLVPTGGVTSENVKDWFDAGAVILGVGGAILDKKAIQIENYSLLTERTKIFKQTISLYREN